MCIKVTDHHKEIIEDFDDTIEYLAGILSGKYEDNSGLQNLEIKLKEITSLKYSYIKHVLKSYSKFVRGQSVVIKYDDKCIGTGKFIQSNWNIADNTIYHQVETSIKFDKKSHLIQAIIN